MAVKLLKETAVKPLQISPKDATRDDEYNLYVQQSIAAGVADIDAGRVHSHESIKKMFNVK